MTTPPAAETGTAFLQWLDEWYAGLAPASLALDVVQPAGGSEHVGIVVVDLLVGFCTQGVLASPRVGALGPPTAAFLRAAWEAGLRRVVIARDAHPEDSPEFRSFPPHCIRGTAEADLIPELAELPFAPEFAHVEKGSLNVGLERAFTDFEARHPEIQSWIIVGDCTDLCVYQAAMHFRLHANTRGTNASVWVPADLVNTFDLDVATALKIGAMPHDGELMHRLFLYHLALNGVSVVRSLGA